MSLGTSDVWLFSMWERHAWQIGSPGTDSTVLVFLPQVLQGIPFGELPWLSMFGAPLPDRPRITAPGYPIAPSSATLALSPV